MKVQPEGQTERILPFDAEPVIATKPGSYMQIIDNRAKFVKLDPGEKGYVSHFTTCEYAALFRRKNKIDKLAQERMKPILLKDLAGMMKLLSDQKSMVSLKDIWHNDEFREAIKSLNPEETEAIVKHKDDCKLKFVINQFN